MFQFPGLAPIPGAAPPARRVPPFGHPRIYGHLRLPAAFRSLSRPSSPLRAKASPVRPFLTFSSRVPIVKNCLYLHAGGFPPARLTFDSWLILSNLSSFPYVLFPNMSNASRALRRAAAAARLPAPSPADSRGYSMRQLGEPPATSLFRVALRDL